MLYMINVFSGRDQKAIISRTFGSCYFVTSANGKPFDKFVPF